MSLAKPLKYLKLFLVLNLSIILLSCGEENSSESTEGEFIEVPVDSFEIDSPSGIDEYMPAIFGSWQTTNMKIGDLLMSQEDMKLPIREFAENGIMILHGEEGRQEDPFSLEPGKVIMDDGLVMNVELLSEDSLILSQIVDGVEAKYIHVRVD